MHRLFTKKEILTIPNMLSIFRLLLLPLIIWFYTREHYIAALLVLFLSGISDIADGIIARKFNMVSDFGKIIDPIADKLTQGTLLLCIAIKHRIVIVLIAIFALKEILMATLGYLIIRRKDSVNSARWYGKLNTVIIYSTIVLLIVFPNIPKTAVNIMVFTCIAIIVISFILYARFYQKILNDNKQSE